MREETIQYYIEQLKSNEFIDKDPEKAMIICNNHQDGDVNAHKVEDLIKIADALEVNYRVVESGTEVYRPWSGYDEDMSPVVGSEFVGGLSGKDFTLVEWLDYKQAEKDIKDKTSGYSADGRI